MTNQTGKSQRFPTNAMAIAGTNLIKVKNRHRFRVALLLVLYATHNRRLGSLPTPGPGMS